jgi:hypothetical protein
MILPPVGNPTLQLLITASDLNALGEYDFLMNHPKSVSASTCHTIKMAQDGIFLGEAYYSGILMPQE